MSNSLLFDKRLNSSDLQFKPVSWLQNSVVKICDAICPHTRDGRIDKAIFTLTILMSLSMLKVSAACDCLIPVPDGFVTFKSALSLEAFLDRAAPDCLNVCIQGGVALQGELITDSDLDRLSKATSGRHVVQVQGEFLIKNTLLTRMPSMFSQLSFEESGSISVVGNQELKSLLISKTATSRILSISVSGNENLETFILPKGLAELSDGFSVFDNKYLREITGFDKLIVIGGVYVEGNRMMQSLDFNSTASVFVKGSILIANNSEFTSVDLSGLTSNMEGGHLTSIEVYSNSNLVSLIGPETGISSIDYVNIASNPKLESISGFSSIIRVGQRLRIGSYLGGSQALVNDKVFAEVSEVGVLSILHNDNMENLDWLSSLDEINGSLYILNNNRLCDCSINVVCSYLINHSANSSSIGIRGNLACCGSVEAVLDSCDGRCEVLDSCVGN